MQKEARETGARSRAVNIATFAHAATTPFPELTSLSLRTPHFDFHVSDPDLLYDIVGNILHRFQANKAHQKTLHVNGCIIIATAGRARKLEEYVREFHWGQGEGDATLIHGKVVTTAQHTSKCRGALVLLLPLPGFFCYSLEVTEW